LALASGVVGVGGDLKPGTLIRAYSDGVFPWFNEGDPIMWWSPDPRGIFELEHFHIPRRLQQTLRQPRWTVTINQAFPQVIQACAQNRDDGTWITNDMIEAYTALHQIGVAHSVEVWTNAELVGGIYGIALGGFFAGESMFHRVRDASKVALVALRNRLVQRGFQLFDTQIVNDHTAQFGAIDIPRNVYLERLRKALQLRSVSFA
jgi:leucyl/phenylalanyl-tRNA--protein transferase